MHLGYDDAGVFTGVARDGDWPLDVDGFDVAHRRKNRVFEALLAGGEVVLYSNAAECIARLAAVWPLGIASGALRHEIEATIKGRALDRYIRFIVASGDTPRGKPAPDPYTRAGATLHGVPPAACLAIEDSRWGIESAKAAGLWCIGITNTYPVSELMDADAIITSLELTPDLIRTLG